MIVPTRSGEFCERRKEVGSRGIWMNPRTSGDGYISSEDGYADHLVEDGYADHLVEDGYADHLVGGRIYVSSRIRELKVPLLAQMERYRPNSGTESSAIPIKVG